MALIYNSTDLTALAAQYQCCASALGLQALKAEKYGASDYKCFQKKMLFLSKASCIVADYTVPGTLLTPGFISSAALDFTGETVTPDQLTGNIIINGNTIAILPLTNYVNTDALIDGIVAAINSASVIYSASNESVGVNKILVINTTNPANQANGFVVNIVINPAYASTAEAPEMYWQHSGAIYINSPTASTVFRDKIIIAGQLADMSGLAPYIRILDPTTNTYTDVALPVYGWPATILAQNLAYDEVNDRIYISGFNATSKYLYLSNTLTPSALVGFIGPSGNNNTYMCYNPVDQCKYAVTQDGFLFRISPTEVLTQVVTGLTGAVKMICNTDTGDMWIVGSTNVYVVNLAGALVATITTGGAPKDITYCSEPGNEFMLISSYVLGASFMSTYSSTGYTLIDPSFYSMVTGTTFTIATYLPEINLIVAYNDVVPGGGSEIDIINTSGNLYQTVTIQPDVNTGTTPVATNFLYDSLNSRIWASVTNNTIFSETLSSVFTLELTDQGTAQFDGALEGGVPPTYTTGDENCLTEDEFQNIIEVSNSICCQIDY